MAKYNVSKSEAKRLGIKREKVGDDGDDDKKSSSSSEKDAKKETKKYYKEEKGAAESQAKTYTDRLAEDVQRVLKDAGIATNRAIQDYTKNMKNIEADHKTEIKDLNYYVQTSKGRAQEDLDTALSNETRRYALEYDKINRSLADAGLTFSERKPEQVAKETSAIQKEAIETEAERSFSDIARYQFVQNRDIETKYGREAEEIKTNKGRTIEDINAAVASSKLDIKRQQEDISTGLANTLRALERGEKVDIGQIGQMYDQVDLAKRLSEQEYNALG